MRIPFLSGKRVCPASEEEKALVEECFLKLESLLGTRRMRSADVVTPTKHYFPHAYDGSPEALAVVFETLRRQAALKRRVATLVTFQGGEEMPEEDESGLMRHSRCKGKAGIYWLEEDVHHIAVHANVVVDPQAVVGTIAHELSHAVLTEAGADREYVHHEAMTDLAAVYIGLGILVANSLLRRQGWVESGMQYWRLKRTGYISPEMAGWALALFACARGETDPAWAKYLETDPQAYLKQGTRYLRATRDTRFLSSVLLRQHIETRR
jgi:hypothetical protein